MQADGPCGVDGAAQVEHIGRQGGKAREVWTQSDSHGREVGSYKALSISGAVSFMWPQGKSDFQLRGSPLELGEAAFVLEKLFLGVKPMTQQMMMFLDPPSPPCAPLLC
jgi:hypothetical protein|mmetsp:Transcript_70323/g.117389  ORF Transcript_70323/g.117389 Transcript_70323/m.117389 type:complete len:109 (-) Transcript_70323:517-843(-)|eukprot:CAMPEP_0174282688 /NCGR_PEP_ID=MMETSP0809-20121228/3235_1 /TAXON_ID=73025 ORGANISM="Eutreptiella gymnastica-like, Strain CCMP1594" /NCGR_SAMPLE_ID=MMETSP0809 /ASSEMBLY_ACC=CAM_ASM_000658 /LENGTH=108 /DNA_ID=CAMNT_0015377079 /DNA_START=337 /DNA_END=663 /DNA_ORIENTATION=+